MSRPTRAGWTPGEWTKEKPKVAWRECRDDEYKEPEFVAYYWYRDAKNKESIHPVWWDFEDGGAHIILDDGNIGYLDNLQGEWSGPIPSPSTGEWQPVPAPRE